MWPSLKMSFNTPDLEPIWMQNHSLVISILHILQLSDWPNTKSISSNRAIRVLAAITRSRLKPRFLFITKCCAAHQWAHSAARTDKLIRQKFCTVLKAIIKVICYTWKWCHMLMHGMNANLLTDAKLWEGSANTLQSAEGSTDGKCSRRATRGEYV